MILPRSQSSVSLSLYGVWQGICVWSSIVKPSLNSREFQFLVPSSTQCSNSLQCQGFPLTLIVRKCDVLWNDLNCFKFGNVSNSLCETSICSSAFAFSSTLISGSGHAISSNACKFTKSFSSKAQVADYGRHGSCQALKPDYYAVDTIDLNHTPCKILGRKICYKIVKQMQRFYASDVLQWWPNGKIVRMATEKAQRIEAFKSIVVHNGYSNAA